MELLALILGVVLGALAACVYFRRHQIGVLRFACEKDSSPYMFLELTDPDVMKIAKKKRVVLKVNSDIVVSHK